MSTQATCAGSRNATSLQGSEFGRSPFGVPDGQMIDLFGPVPVLANLSARQARELGLMMSDTSGQASYGLSGSARLQSSLENRLRHRLNGSALCEVTWSDWDTPWGRRLSKPLARVRAIFATEYSLWRTPMASDGRKGDCRLPGVLKRLESGRQISLAMQARLTLSSASMEEKGQLNPGHARWLMRIPEEWESCAPTETVLMLKQQRNS